MEIKVIGWLQQEVAAIENILKCIYYFVAALALDC